MDYTPPRGMRDFAPEKMALRSTVVQTITSIFRQYGYSELQTPALERLETLTRKAGDEIEGQIFRIEGDLGLRYDLTVPLARYVSGTQFAPPFKRYCIAPVWRREEPQKGRFREFYQADIDIIGSNSMKCEAELLACARDCLIALGFSNPKILINNRKILNSLARKLKLREGQVSSVFRALDKKGKASEEKIKGELIAAGLSDSQVSKLFEFVDRTGSNRELLAYAEKSAAASEGAGELSQLLEYCKGYGFEPTVDFSLVRGLGYYTGPVFEIILSDEIGSVSGGGRYDNLLSSYGKANPAVGISLGIERVIALLEGNADKPASPKAKTVYVAPVKEEFYQYAQMAANELRAAGIAAETDLADRNLRKQFEFAANSGYSFVAIVGQKEKDARSVTLRNLSTGKEELLPISNAISLLQNETGPVI